MQQQPALQANNVFKSFCVDKQNVEVLKGLSLTIPKGAFHAVMGPSGSGKSTLMNLLAGLLPVDKGDVAIAGQSLVGRSDKSLTILRRREVGIIFQDYNLSPTLTVEENIILPVLLDGKMVPTQHLEHLLSLVGLQHRRNQPADRLSGGEAQRTAIARAFVANPQIILADEPTGNLDTPAAKDFCETLTTLNHNLGTAILLISHDAQVAAIADVVHILRDGKILGAFETDHDAAHVATRYLEFITQ
ncbi:MAG: ABC transporter ATP-binding protein [bacterium]|nr:ABC transporter ATP-binding protein [bacterium]